MSATADRTVRLPLELAPQPGQMAVVEAAGRRVGLVSLDGELHALADACPHRGAPLCSAGEIVAEVELADGRVVLRESADHVRCPWHRWDFDVRSGVCASKPDLRVRRYAVRVEGAEIVVGLDPLPEG